MATKKRPTKPTKRPDPSKGRGPSKPSKRPTKAKAKPEPLGFAYTREEVQRNREAWLTQACEALGDVFAAAGFARPPTVRVSVGWPLGVRPGKRARAIGQIFAPSVAGDGVFHVFISPELSAADPVEVLAVLTHELTHAIVGFAAGHGPEFRRVAEGVGLVGPMTATKPGPGFNAHAATVLGALPPYPHAGIHFDRLGDGERPEGEAPRPEGEAPRPEGFAPRTFDPTRPNPRIHSGPKPQRNRWIKFGCEACGWSGRTTASGIAAGLPTCACGGTMREVDAPS